jgi:hypothetical protein
MPTKSCDILIQAGHENTPDGATGGEGPLGNEIDWTPIVANEAVAVLRAAGVNAVKEDASIKHTDRAFGTNFALDGDILCGSRPGVTQTRRPNQAMELNAGRFNIHF